MSVELKTWVASKTTKAYSATRAQLNRIAVKYNPIAVKHDPFLGAHHKFIEVTFLEGDMVRICKTKNREIRPAHHHTQPKAIWLLKRHMHPVVAPAPAASAAVVAPAQEVEVEGAPDQMEVEVEGAPDQMEVEAEGAPAQGVEGIQQGMQDVDLFWVDSSSESEDELESESESESDDESDDGMMLPPPVDSMPVAMQLALHLGGPVPVPVDEDDDVVYMGETLPPHPPAPVHEVSSDDESEYYNESCTSDSDDSKGGETGNSDNDEESEDLEADTEDEAED